MTQSLKVRQLHNPPGGYNKDVTQGKKKIAPENALRARQSESSKQSVDSANVDRSQAQKVIQQIKGYKMNDARSKKAQAQKANVDSKV